MKVRRTSLCYSDQSEGSAVSCWRFEVSRTQVAETFMHALHEAHNIRNVDSVKVRIQAVLSLIERPDHCYFEARKNERHDDTMPLLIIGQSSKGHDFD